MKKINLPHIGQRIIKSAVGVFLCYLIYFLRGQNGIPFYSMLAVLWCIQPYTDKTYKMAVQRTIGTIIGAVYGLIVMLLEIYIFNIYNNLYGYFLNALVIIPVLYTTVLLRKQNASYFSCVVYLSIVVNHMTDSNPYIFVLNRILDTFIGIAVGIAVNNTHLPRKKNKECLFVAALDDMISPVKDELSAYSKVEINRMLDEGMNFTVATMRTPASLIRTLNEVDLKLPVIVMNGAALYDLKENTYLKAYVISNESIRELKHMIRNNNLNCFINALYDDTLVIYYQKLENYAEKDIFKTLKCSPYRCYVNREPTEKDRTVYIMIVDKTDKINPFYNQLAEKYNDRFKILCYKSDKYDGYSYIKIYNKNADTDNMIQYLAELQKLDYKKLIESNDKNKSDFNSIVHELKNSYEPIIFK
ncbi:MAG: HAD hydrolase family protein [Alistipes sp.]|nr:HAD hydrolase family protein [Alistipes sp.]